MKTRKLLTFLESLLIDEDVATICYPIVTELIGRVIKAQLLENSRSEIIIGPIACCKCGPIIGLPNKTSHFTPRQQFIEGISKDLKRYENGEWHN